jgi:O-antigen/teichoic acid export membrane protein
MAEGTLTRGLSYGTVTFGLLTVFSVASSILTARLFGVVVIGEFALVTAPSIAVAVLSTVREQPALVRKLAGAAPGDPLVTGLFVAVFSFSVALTFVTVALAAVATWFLFHGPIDQPELFMPAVVALIGYAVIINTAWNLDYVFAAFMASGPLFRVRLTQGVLFPVLATGLSFVRSDVWALVAAHYASWGVATVYRLWSVRTIMPYRLTADARRAGLAELPGILKFGLKITPGFLAIGASNQSATWILGATSSVATVGAYSRASSVTGRLGELNFRITEMLFPALVTRQHAGDTVGFDRAVVDTLRYVLIGLLAPAAVMGGAASGILAVFGPGFETAATALPILAIVPAAMSATAVLAHTMFALNKTNATTAIAGLRLLVTAGGGVVLTSAYGLNGMAAAVSLGAVVQLIAQTAVTLPQLSTPVRRLWPWRQTVGIVAGCVAGFGVARALDVAVPGVAGLLAALTLGLVAFLTALAVVGGILERDRARMMTIRRRVATRFARQSVRPA